MLTLEETAYPRLKSRPTLYALETALRFTPTHRRSE